MMMMLTQDEIDSLLSSISPGASAEAAVPPAAGAEGAVLVSGTPNAWGGDFTAPGLAGASGVPRTPSLQDILDAEKEKNYKIYNFKRPDKFAKDQLRALETIHESFARNTGLLFGSFLRTNVEIDVVSVDQLTYDELVKSMPRPIAVGVIEGLPLVGQMLMGISHEVTMCIIDRMLGGTGSNATKNRELSDIEARLMERILQKMLKNLDASWKGITPVHFILKAMEESYHLLQITPPGEIVAAVTLEVTIGNQDSGLISICYPYPMLEKVINSLSSQHLFTSTHAESEDLPSYEQEILEKMHHAPVPLSVVVGGTSLNVGQVLALKPGDVLRLDRRAGQDLLVCINHKPKFLCQPGVFRKNMAVCIQDSVLHPEAVHGFALDQLTNDVLEDDLYPGTLEKTHIQ
jgi:flagellar motor switch protein FliM